MRDDVRLCMDARMNMFTQYYTVPADLQQEVDGFYRDICEMAESSADAVSFEASYGASDLNGRFTALLMQCTPKPYHMTQQEKQASNEVKKQLRQENKGQLARDILEDVTESVMLEAEEEMIAQRRQTMIEEGVFRDYTVLSNAAEDARWLGKGIGKLFGRGKK